MTNYREILRLHSQGISGRSIAISCECSRNTVASTLKRKECPTMNTFIKSLLNDITKGPRGEQAENVVKA